MVARILTLTLSACSLRLGVALRSRSSDALEDKVASLPSYTFRSFVRDFNRVYIEGSTEWVQREELFNKHKEEALSFNALPDQTWRKGISKFMDHTDAEKKRLLGYKGARTQGTGVNSAATSFKRVNMLPSTYEVVAAAKESKLLRSVRDQGNCGSCWAEAATATLEGQMEVNATLMSQIAELRTKSRRVPASLALSDQVVISCTDNPRNCGGSGGCSGATVELAYAMLQDNGGLPFASEWGYEARAQECRREVFEHHKIGIRGFTVLPSNKLHPLQDALVTTGGPVAISVDASNWYMYYDGVYSDGPGDFAVNHAVTLMGYKMPKDSEQGWWKIKNSWGSFWGENGYIRVEMKADEESHCGWDYRTHDGIACDGDPDSAWVCGTCGILYDSVYPTGLYLQKGES